MGAAERWRPYFMATISKLEKIENLFRKTDPIGMIKKSYSPDYYNRLILDLATQLNFKDSTYSIHYKLWRAFRQHYKKHMFKYLTDTEFLNPEAPTEKDYIENLGHPDSFWNLAQEIRAILGD